MVVLVKHRLSVPEQLQAHHLQPQALAVPRIPSRRLALVPLLALVHRLLLRLELQDSTDLLVATKPPAQGALVQRLPLVVGLAEVALERPKLADSRRHPQLPVDLVGEVSAVPRLTRHPQLAGASISDPRLPSRRSESAAWSELRDLLVQPNWAVELGLLLVS